MMAGQETAEYPLPAPGPLRPHRHEHRHRRGRGSLPILAGLLALMTGLALAWGLGPATPGRASTATRPSTATRVTPLNVATIESRADPAIVDVAATLASNGGEAVGTGIVLTSTGRVLTNNHVIDGATIIRATDIGNGKAYTATVVGFDRSADVAVLQLQGAFDLQTANIGDSSKLPSPS